MSRRLAILTEQLSDRPLWEPVPGNPLVEKNRETGMMRAVGLTAPVEPPPTKPAAQKQKDWDSDIPALSHGEWVSITPDQSFTLRKNLDIEVMVLQNGTSNFWLPVKREAPRSYVDETGRYRARYL